MSANTGSEKVQRQCSFYVTRKKRKCRMLVKESEIYCCEHQPINESTSISADEPGVRIPCPYDRKHTCYAHKLRKHLKICNSRPKESQPFIVKGINSGSPEISENNDTITLSSTPVEEIKSVIEKMNRICKEESVNIEEKICKHKVVEDEMMNPIYGDKTKKHLKQVSSVLGLLSEYELLNPKTCYIEFGAGRGALSYWISKATTDETNILLIEKASPKHKKDNKLDKTSDNVQRVRADISDLVLDELELVNKSEHIVGVTKHLCGAATDFTIRCLAHSTKNKQKLLGFLMTFCCHHRCTWSSFTGREYFEKLGLTENDFRIMCGLVSWATCGTGLSRERREELSKKSPEELEKDEKSLLGLSVQEKEQIGLKCKNLMNWGRLQFIKDIGFNCALHYYVKCEVTPENVCIVATNKDFKN
ncbi:tRNA:m(4)X modification enzyme TRM13 homolog [Harmonia axyridis]|uniref:tRNA:m(4)X modification enzyme TRM13 homolog n=1 Tax=Harmonia axyridis TaxID=115357 RepID=UPI001E279ADF|nr:tRNA:m(4)X modification enzyme TRM13 homolog [Harmonia axyridis]